MAKQNDLHFKTNVQLKSIIGKDLINDDNIAILELVKNSFDADAKQVKIKYFNLKQNDDKKVETFSDFTSRLIIQDDGIGMDITDIRDKWLNIAYSEKKSNKTQHKRRMAGAKGVGRFSCDRLGEYLNLYSKTANDDKYFKLSIDWKKFEIEDENKEIQSIPLKYETLTPKEFQDLGFIRFEHGVLLEIIKLRSTWAYSILDKNGNITNWDANKFVDLKKYLEKLINPNQAFESNDFGVFIDSPEFINENNSLNDNSKFIGKVENRIFEHLDFKTTSIETKITNNGNELYTELKDKGETIFWIREKNPFYPSITNSKATIYYLSPYAKSFFTKQTGIRSVDYGSIFLFINGFRVPPYGEFGNDWLGIDQRKAQGHSRYIGLRELVGQIEILDEENDFQIVSSREGIVKNDSFKTLTQSDNNNSFFYKAFRRLERYVVEGLNWDRAHEDEDLLKIHKKIVSGETKEEDLEYYEDTITKQKRVYSTIHNIISAKASEVIELYINENLITQKIDEEREVTEREFNQLIEDFSNKKIDSNTLNKILQKKALENADLEKQLKEFSKYTTNEATSKAILELQNYKETIEKQTKLIQELQNQLEELKRQKDSAEKSAITYKEKASKVEEDLTTEKEKNLYLLATRRTLSPDADGLIHTIKINNIEVRDGIENIIDDLTEDDYNVQDLIKKLGFLKICAERSLKMAEFATRADLKEDIEKREIDIVTYIEEYVTLYGETFSEKLKFTFSRNNSRLTKSLSVLNMSIILDNLISNAVKWGADKIHFEFEQNSDKKLSVFISDNGNGLSQRYLDNSDKIFELSVRDTPPTGLSGSGIGLYYTKNLLNEMNCDIEFVGNGTKLSGATFEIKFNTI
ncbi:Histidine kinase-, DNA gyrase B-, and HSP90-like ATPase [Flavobacterium gillisiae]|uniref:histidine kinase n=1 Tax=Flavobacterium gillisiae TaxID=150146 RepID=A0A1H4FTZ8_9FLAO|nr:ATP-binding protein [Flavobacterium gillisiae]SEB00829.1 Histidine kinase-, DNA gyrase B-, and HSP90-like ATPase [Flavobacterium gillisiae]